MMDMSLCLSESFWKIPLQNIQIVKRYLSLFSVQILRKQIKMRLHYLIIPIMIGCGNSFSAFEKDSGIEDSKSKDKTISESSLQDNNDFDIKIHDAKIDKDVSIDDHNVQDVSDQDIFINDHNVQDVSDDTVPSTCMS